MRRTELQQLEGEVLFTIQKTNRTQTNHVLFADGDWKKTVFKFSGKKKEWAGHDDEVRAVLPNIFTARAWDDYEVAFVSTT